jgi:hypothetical protein
MQHGTISPWDRFSSSASVFSTEDGTIMVG